MKQKNLHMKNLIFILFIFLATSAIAQENNFSFSGKILELDSDFMLINITDPSAKNGTRWDSIKIKNGIFMYEGYIKQMTMFSISPNTEKVMKRSGKGYYPVKSSLLQFMASPGSKITFSGKITDFVEAYPTGDAANNDLAKLNKSVFPLMNESVNLNLKIANKIITDSVEIAKAKAKAKLIDDEVVTIKTKFLADNLASPTTAWLLSDMMIRSQISNENAAAMFAKMDKNKLVATPFYTEVAKRVDGFNATGAGKIVPEIITINTYDKAKFNLSSLKGKYVVLDFWGTWCGPCIAGMPKMKEYLDKYKAKMDIVGIAKESDNGDRWRNFLKEKPEYQWHHVLSRDNEDYILKFNVAGYPTKIIVDPEGKIVGRYVGEDDEIYNKLDEIFK